MFSVRIVNVDHYLSAPLQGLDITYSQFRGSRVKQVPVIRIFGSTPTGQKTCLHVHGVFPYLLIPYDGKENVQALMYIIATSLDKAINISFGVSNSNKQHVFKIVQVSGSPFYGYHEVEHQFLKIFFYNPNVVKRAADFLQNGAICNKVLQPHGAHVPFTLQFFIDYNLHGMSFIHLKQVVFRKNIVEESDEAEIGFERLSRCELEVDAIATDISNKCDITENIAVNPGLAGIWEEEKQRRKDDNNFFEPIQSQPRLNVETTPSELLLKNKLRNTLSQQNRCSNPQLTSQIPYPAETQKGSDILNASAVNVHCMLPLTAVKPDNRLDESIVDEDIIHTLTSQSDEEFTLSTQDQSLLTVLLNLAGHEDENGDKEETKENNQSSCKIHYTVEDDSILGSQLLTNAEEEEDLLEACQKIEDTELQINITQNMEKEVVSENIPQIDGTDDLLNRMNTEKHKNSVNSCTEDCEIKMFEDDNSCSIIDMSAEVQSPNLWPLVGIRKEIDCCDEVFSDSIEAIKFVERSDSDVCINIEDNFDDVLRGDIFMSQTVASSFDDASFYTSKESLTCAWNNSLPIQSLENSESDDFLITRLNDIDKLGDNQLKVESYLSDVTEKHLQFNDNLVPLLNLSEGEESVYNKYIDSNPTFYSNDVLDKKQLLDIFKESIELQIQENEGRTPHEDSNSNSSILLKKEKLSLRNQGKQRSVKNIQFSKIKIKFKFPNKGETINSNKKLRFLRRKTVCDISKKHVLAYFRKLEKLKKSYLSAKASFISNKKQKSNKQLTEKSSFRKKLKFQEVQNKNCFVNNLNKYKLKKCFVLVERLQLNSDLIVVKKNTNDTKSIKPRKIINELEVLQSRPFSTDILNSSSKTNKHMTKLKLINKVNDVGEILNKQKVNETKSYCLLSETKPDGDQKVNDCNNIDLNYCDKNDKHYRTDILNNNKRRRKIHVAENKGEVIHSKTNTFGVKKKQTKHKLNNCINVCDGDNVSAPLLQVFNQETINTEIIENVHNNKSTSNNSKSPNLVKTSKENQDNEVCNLLKMIPKIEKVVDETIKYKSNIKPLSEKKRKENVKINSDNLEIETKGCNTRNSLKNMKINCAVQLNESNKLESKKRTHQNDGKTSFKHIGMGRKMQSKRNNYHTTEIKRRSKPTR